MGGRIAIMLALLIIFVVALALVAGAIRSYERSRRASTVLSELTEGDRLYEQYNHYLDRAEEAREAHNDMLARHCEAMARHIKQDAKLRGYDVS